jgi:hypothetical protein
MSVRPVVVAAAITISGLYPQTRCVRPHEELRERRRLDGHDAVRTAQDEFPEVAGVEAVPQHDRHERHGALLREPAPPREQFVRDGAQSAARPLRNGPDGAHSRPFSSR